MAIKIGITGGIGSGKSMVSHLLQVMGIPVYISDAEAKRLICSDPFIRKGLQALLGKDIYSGNTLNKQLLASYLFASPEHAQIINGIIHPRVKENFRQWVHHQINTWVVGIESAILVEAGFTDEVDVVVMIYAPEELRISRAIRRDTSSRELIEKRIQSQMNDEKKREYADFVIINDDKTPLIPQILNLMKSLRGT
ncbi:dephospho-CoA kinase [Bacteroides heparinolyticus]|uniref:dephospho-CoA kinase n=1 Tax=Prevotella heparinolytica TaxID=28113 RepID=UPI0028E922A8|nr:dephospho-CoA kinase [Bacteroides heparinolyticus]